jgi:hypothetical protein
VDVDVVVTVVVEVVELFAAVITLVIITAKYKYLLLRKIEMIVFVQR